MMKDDGRASGVHVSIAIHQIFWCAMAVGLAGCAGAANEGCLDSPMNGIVGPRDLRRDRMDLNPGVYRYVRVYEARWDRHVEQPLVRLRLNPGHLWGNQFEVEMIARSGQVISTGVVRTPTEPELPYALVELKSESDLLPASVRGQWTLGVAFASTELRFNSARPTTIRTELAVSNGFWNIVRVEPIEWDRWPQTNVNLHGVGADQSTVYRWAERALDGRGIEY